MNNIHPTAIIGKNVKMGTGNYVGPHCILEGDLVMGDNNYLDAGVITHHIVKIGDGCHFYPYVTIGFAGEMGAKGDKLPENAGVEIGNKVTIREYVNVHAAYWWEATRIGDGSYIMNKAYLAHDVQIGRGVIINAGVCLGGRAIIQDFANVGMGATVHQRSVVGESAMVGMNAAVKKHVPPFAVVAGVPAKILKFNRVGAERRGMEDLDWVEKNYGQLLQNPGQSGHPVAKALFAFFEKYQDCLR